MVWHWLHCSRVSTAAPFLASAAHVSAAAQATIAKVQRVRFICPPNSKTHEEHFHCHRAEYTRIPMLLRVADAMRKRWAVKREGSAVKKRVGGPKKAA